MSEIEKTIIYNIKTLMFIHNYNLKSLSKITGIWEGNVSKQLKGNRSFRTKHLEQYSKAFKITPSQLLDKNLITVKINENVESLRNQHD